MEIKDDIERFYIQHFIMSKSQNIETPGFVFFRLSGKTPLYARQVVMPEDFFVNLEKAMAKRGPETAGRLYSTGKRFGYRFSMLGNFSTCKDKPGRQLVSYIDVINKFIEGTYATRIGCDIDVDRKSVRYTMQNPVVVDKLGYGYFMPLGAAAGLMSYLFQDPSIEGVLEGFDLKSGMGSLLYAPSVDLISAGKSPSTERDLSGMEPTPEYEEFNRVRKLQYSDYSLRTLLDSKFFTFDRGFMMCGGERYFILEVSALYLIETNLRDYSGEIYNAAFDVGMQVLKGVKNPTTKTVSDYMSAFGWGDVLVASKGAAYFANSDYFPYAKFYRDASYLIFSGFLAGMLSTLSGRTVSFSTISKDVRQGYLRVSLS